jgi:hypothetical protein
MGQHEPGMAQASVGILDVAGAARFAATHSYGPGQPGGAITYAEPPLASQRARQDAVEPVPGHTRQHDGGGRPGRPAHRQAATHPSRRPQDRGQPARQGRSTADRFRHHTHLRRHHPNPPRSQSPASPASDDDRRGNHPRPDGPGCASTPPRIRPRQSTSATRACPHADAGQPPRSSLLRPLGCPTPYRGITMSRSDLSEIDRRIPSTGQPECRPVGCRFFRTGGRAVLAAMKRTPEITSPDGIPPGGITVGVGGRCRQPGRR